MRDPHDPYDVPEFLKRHGWIYDLMMLAMALVFFGGIVLLVYVMIWERA